MMAAGREQLKQVPLKDIDRPKRLPMISSPYEIDLEELKRLALLRCSVETIARRLSCTPDRLRVWIKTNRNGIRDCMDLGHANHEVQLRANALKLSAKNATTLIFMMKNSLGMTDNSTVALTGPNGEPLQTGASHLDSLERSFALLEKITDLRRIGPENAPELDREDGAKEADSPAE